VLDSFQATGLSVEAACRGVEAAGKRGSKRSTGGRQYSRASKSQVGNVDLGMVVR
jgi:hypothetical protein